jgi:2-polyprenyl-3-methyl-5-hydroxy-6-metoxy-1,4-benzoquinol methylase
MSKDGNERLIWGFIIMLDEIWETYDPTSPEKDFDYWLITFDFEILKKFLKGKKVIELGCSRGFLTQKLAGICEAVIVVEGSEKNINHAKDKTKNCSNVQFYHSLWQDFEYSGSDVSDVVFFQGLEYLDKEIGFRVLNKIRGWLEPNGRLHVVVPNALSLHRKIAYYMGIIKDVHELSERDKMFGQKKEVYDKETLFSELKECGFKVSRWEGIFLKPLPNVMMMNLNEKIIRGFYEISKELPDYCAHIFATCEQK